jgi:hypothetical protein
MKKVFAVSSGEYSDYRVVAIFTTEEKAETYMNAVPSSDYNDIEEYELDPPIADLIKRGYGIWLVHMLLDGSTEQVRKKGLDSFAVSDMGHTLWRRSKALYYTGTGTPDVLVSTVWAKNREHAIKIVNEHRIRLIANNRWCCDT